MNRAARTIELPPDLPYDPFRTGLYTREELVGDGVDAAIEAHVKRNGFRSPPTAEALAQRLHDHAIDVALAQFLRDAGSHRVVGIMGSAATPRDDPWFAAVARLGSMLTRAGFLVASGGGPGIMEAANLGAHFAHDADGLERALVELARVPSYEREPDAYKQLSAEVRERAGEGAVSLAIPTWFYPGEPVGQFASHIAKYFANSIREDGLLAIAVCGIVFAPGRAGTTQELFQDAAQNAYGIHGRSPMVLLGREAYGGDPSIHGVLVDQARRYGGYERLIALCDTPEEALAFLEANQPAEAAEALAGEPDAILSFMRNDRQRARR